MATVQQEMENMAQVWLYRLEVMPPDSPNRDAIAYSLLYLDYEWLGPDVAGSLDFHPEARDIYRHIAQAAIKAVPGAQEAIAAAIS